MDSRLGRLWQTHGQIIRLGIAITIIILIFVPVQGFNFNVFAGSNSHNNDKDNGHDGDNGGKKCKMLYECKKIKQKNEGKASASGFGTTAVNVQSNHLDDKGSSLCKPGSSNDKSCNDKSIQSKNPVRGDQQNHPLVIHSPKSTSTSNGHNVDKTTNSDKQLPTSHDKIGNHQSCQGPLCTKDFNNNIHIKDQITKESK